ncbi:cobalamin synthesis protein, P47K [Magnetococcus marinus MC-1]|uniref:Cobalamin synthesis protein, P47K n=1 Tax=Magnetococcus marinus (strain ATCC BAA-1437 / JCM 17883 / MC-1) TaxID=156889 RepID=A0L8F2_MAGMM|nr:GTP-binding protein [Magnetococcus marinus]ABK44245.1 cobalamin synthesis protein, P47K [Magnetococcus marinus MC-1]
MSIPVTIITGYLGVGKTTVIRHLLTHNKGGATWAVVVNEFGDVPIDGAIMSSGGVAIKELAGGCICCTLGADMETALGEILDTIQPERILIEPTGLGHPGGVIEAVTEGKFRHRLTLKSVLCLVDLAMLRDPLLSQRKTFIDQVAIADVVLAAKGDQLNAADYAAFVQWGQELFPPKEVMGKVMQGSIDPAWLDLSVEMRPYSLLLERMVEGGEHHHHGDSAHSHGAGLGATPQQPQLDQPVHFENRGLGHIGGGWIFHVEERFHEHKLMELFEGSLAGIAPVVRMKGLFRVGPTRRILIDRVGSVVTVNDSIAYWRDSRVEVIVPQAAVAPQWARLEQAMLASRWKRKES